MMTCRQVSTLISTGALADAPFTRRLAVRVHLSMCRHCSAFKRQVETLAAAARTASETFGREVPEGFERQLIARIKKV